MSQEDKEAIESSLPEEYRGRRGYKRLLDSVDTRISVGGTRGKSKFTRMAEEAFRELGYSTYAKVTGDRPVSIKDGEIHRIARDPDKPVMIDETIWAVKRHWPMEVMILENQGVSPYTMRVFNNLYCRPHYLVITNVRPDHIGDLGTDRTEIAEAFAKSAPKETTVVCGESDPEIREEMRTVLQDKSVTMVDAAPRGADADLPAFEIVTSLDAVLESVIGSGLTEGQLDSYRRRFENAFSWEESSQEGVRWFHGAPINDVDSTERVLDHLLDHDAPPVTFVAYFRRDRPARTTAFTEFLERCFEHDIAARAYLAGHRSNAVARELRGHPVEIVPDDLDAIPDLVEEIGENCAGEAVMTVGNGAEEWPRRFAEVLGGTEVEAETDTQAAADPDSREQSSRSSDVAVVGQPARSRGGGDG